jgi:hypothetical protein
MKNQTEENQPEKIRPDRPVKVVPLIKQNIILQHKLNKGRLKSEAEKLAYEAGRALGEIFVETKCGENSVGVNGG